MYIYITMGVTTLPILYDRPINYNQTQMEDTAEPKRTFSYICGSNMNFQCAKIHVWKKNAGLIKQN